MNKKIIISVSEKFAEQLEKQTKETGFNSISEYISYILNKLISSESPVSKEEKEEESESPYTPEEETALRKNLEDMGYI